MLTRSTLLFAEVRSMFPYRPSNEPLTSSDLTLLLLLAVTLIGAFSALMRLWFAPRRRLNTARTDTRSWRTRSTFARLIEQVAVGLGVSAPALWQHLSGRGASAAPGEGLPEVLRVAQMTAPHAGQAQTRSGTLRWSVDRIGFDSGPGLEVHRADVVMQLSQGDGQALFVALRARQGEQLMLSAKAPKARWIEGLPELTLRDAVEVPFEALCGALAMALHQGARPARAGAQRTEEGVARRDDVLRGQVRCELVQTPHLDATIGESLTRCVALVRERKLHTIAVILPDFGERAAIGDHLQAQLGALDADVAARVKLLRGWPDAQARFDAVILINPRRPMFSGRRAHALKLLEVLDQASSEALVISDAPLKGALGFEAEEDARQGLMASDHVFPAHLLLKKNLFGKWLLICGANAAISLLFGSSFVSSGLDFMQLVAGILTFVVFYAFTEQSLQERQAEFRLKLVNYGTISRIFLQFIFIVDLACGTLSVGLINQSVGFDFILAPYLTTLLQGALLSIVAMLCGMALLGAGALLRVAQSERAQ